MGTIKLPSDQDITLIAQLSGNTDAELVSVDLNDPQYQIVTISDVDTDDIKRASIAYSMIQEEYQLDPTLMTVAEIWDTLYGGEAKRDIDRAAEQARLRHITPGAGQAMIYQEKAEQAADFVAAGYPANTSGFPLIQTEMDAMQYTKEEAADSILAQRTAWITLGAAIEQVRLAGKKAITDAGSLENIETVRAATCNALDNM